MHSSVLEDVESLSSTGELQRDERAEYHLGRAWYALIIFEIQILAAGIDIAIVSLLVHPIEMAFRINDVRFAAITTVPFAIGLSSSYYPAGLLADTFRRRDMIAISSISWALAALIASRADSAAVLFLARLLAGLGTGLAGPAIFSMLTDAFPRSHRAFAVGLYSAGISIGAGIGLTICGALVAATQRIGVLHISEMVLSPWQQCFAAVTAVGIIVVVLVLTIPEPARRERLTQSSSNLLSSLRVFGRYLQRHGFLWSVLLLGISVSATAIININAWGPVFGMRHFGASSVSSIALLGTLSAGGALLGSILGGILAQRCLNHRNCRMLPRLLVTFTAILCVFSGAFPYMPNWLLTVIGIGAINASFTITWVLVLNGIQEAAPNEVRGQLAGMYGLIYSIPSITGPPIAAFLASNLFAKVGGFEPALAVVGGAASALAVLLFALSGKPYERAKDETRSLVAPAYRGSSANYSFGSQIQKSRRF